MSAFHLGHDVQNKEVEEGEIQSKGELTADK